MLWVARAAAQRLLLVQLDHGAVLLDVHALIRGPIAIVSHRVAVRVILAAHQHLALAHDARDFAGGVELLGWCSDHVDATRLACRGIELV